MSLRKLACIALSVAIIIGLAPQAFAQHVPNVPPGFGTPIGGISVFGPDGMFGPYDIFGQRGLFGYNGLFGERAIFFPRVTINGWW